MERNTVVLILATILVLGFVAASIVRRYLHAKQLLDLRRMVHQERMMAWEKGIEQVTEAEPGSEHALAPVVDQRLVDLLRSSEMGMGNEAGGQRRAALGVGLFLLCSGLGICVAFALSVEDHTFEAWPIGLIPAMAGVGLLLFHRLSAPR